MPDPAIREFFAERKEAWLKKTVKASMTEDEVAAAEQECNTLFSLEVWLPNASKRAGQISISTHPCTFSHPSARKNKNGYVTSVIANAERRADGYLRTGNVEAQADALGNAAALDVHKFLSLIMQDEQSLLLHIQHGSTLATELLSINSASYEQLRDGFLAMTSSAGENVTSAKIKQVYFPVDDDYHQLSILTNSGLLYELRSRLDTLRYSERTKQLRDLKRRNEFSEETFAEIYHLTTIGYGGTKPQNISVLNNQNAGKAHLLLSAPPQLQKRTVHFPKNDFFKESVRYWDGLDAFKKLHGIFTAGIDSVIPQKNLRSGRDARIDDLLDIVIGKMWSIREIPDSQIITSNSGLPAFQKLWLLNDEASIKQRDQSDEWLDEVIIGITGWILHGYQAVIKKPVVLAGEERNYIQRLVSARKEALR